MYWVARLLITSAIFLEMVIALLAANSILNQHPYMMDESLQFGFCPISLESNKPIAHVLQLMTMGSISLRYVIMGLVILIYFASSCCSKVHGDCVVIEERAKVHGGASIEGQASKDNTSFQDCRKSGTDSI